MATAPQSPESAPRCRSGDPPAGSAYWGLAAPLRRTLARSFRRRVGGDPRFDRALDNAFWPGVPATTWEALDNIPDTELNVIGVLFDRVMASVPELWPHIIAIENVWYGSSCGFRCIYDDRAATMELLLSSRAVARDRPHGAAEHQEPTKSFVARLASDADCRCWRELECTGREGLHVCVGTTDRRFDGVHWDWLDPADRRDDGGFCTYDPAISIRHWLQVMEGVDVPPSPFHLDAIASHWAAERRSLAASGLAGRARAAEYVARLREQLDDALDAP